MRTPARAFVGAVVFAAAVAAFSRIPLLPEIGGDLALSAGEIGLLTTAFGLGRLLMDLPAGRLAGAVSPVIGLTWAGAGLAVSCAWLAAADSMFEALVASGLIGCGSALTNTTGMFAFATATGAERRGASMAIYTGALMSGQMAGPALGGAIGSLAGWRPALWVAAGVGAAIAVACLVARRPAGRWPGPATAAAAAHSGAGAGIVGGEPTRRELIVLAGAAFATFFGLAGVIQTLVPLIGDAELGLSPSTIGLAIAIGAAARFVTAWVAGVWSDRFSRKLVLVPSLLLMALGAAVLALSATRGAWVAAIVLIGLGSSAISVAAAALADIVPRHRLGHELGLFRLLGDLGLLIGPAIAGFLYQASGPPLAAGASSAVFLAAAVAAMAWTRPGLDETEAPPYSDPQSIA
jgi:DHA1 family multidrug resistance protein-like MFS transporter